MPGSRRRRRSPSSSTHISTVSLFCGLLLLHAAVTVAFITGSLPIHPTARPRPHHRCKATTMSSHPPPQEHVLATHHANRVLELTLNRPKALNALSSQMLHVLTSHVKRALEDDGVAAVLLTAAEGSRAFSAGGDIKEILAARLSEKEAVPQGKSTQVARDAPYDCDVESRQGTHSPSHIFVTKKAATQRRTSRWSTSSIPCCTNSPNTNPWWRCVTESPWGAGRVFSKARGTVW